MLKVAYLANRFPAAVEPYVGEEIEELRRRGVQVIAGSVRRPKVLEGKYGEIGSDAENVCLQPIRLIKLIKALWFALKHRNQVSDLLARVLLHGHESPHRRMKALFHTWLGAYYAIHLRHRGVSHIHVHHGYFSSWIGMVAARLLGISYSLTLHGSDLLVHDAYLDTKLENCRFCITISEFNRRYILKRFPAIGPRKIVVSRLGVEVQQPVESRHRLAGPARGAFTLLAVGRLHAVKDHAFLIRACARLRDRGLHFKCAIAGEGPERRRLESLIRQNGLQACITLLGHVPHERMDSLYRRADVVVLTSRSEGIPLVLMEAMVRGRIVLAPAITGIPELVIGGKTGFLYASGELEDFVAQICFLQELICAKDRPGVRRLDWVRHAARAQVLHNFNREKNLAQFADRFLKKLDHKNFAIQEWSHPHENFVLQQI